jgi:hypothetical protein
MARVLCAYSGVEFKVEHFPIYLDQRECYHPIFCLSQRKLIALSPKWAAGELTNIDSYLLFLALLNSTELVEFRSPAFLTEHTDSIVANNMTSLLRICSKINTVKHPELALPRFVLSVDTRDLSNVANWIEMWHSSYSEFADGYRTYSHSQRVLRREEALERLIKNPLKTPDSYAKTLADWAAIAGKFPTGTIPYDGQQVELADYWKMIIRKCARAESIFSIPEIDLRDLIDHCEEYIPAGDIYSFELFKLLRLGASRQASFLGLGDYIPSLYGKPNAPNNWVVLSEDTSVETANKLAMVAAAPEVEPRQDMYPNKLSYLKARANWDMAIRFKHKDIGASNNTSSNTSSNTGTIDI